jgi:hypothetical protein
MSPQIILSTAYFPPIEYLARIFRTEKLLIEKEENYHKQTYRNRCYILSANGPQCISVPVYSGTSGKTKVKDIRIDYSKRWQQVHLGAIRSSYGSSPYFQYYFEDFERTIQDNHPYLLDLNMNLLELILKTLGIEKTISFTTDFLQTGDHEGDLRYEISPKLVSGFKVKEYLQVYSNLTGFVPGLSILDLIFNTGPDSTKYL